MLNKLFNYYIEFKRWFYNKFNLPVKNTNAKYDITVFFSEGIYKDYETMPINIKHLLGINVDNMVDIFHNYIADIISFNMNSELLLNPINNKELYDEMLGDIYNNLADLRFMLNDISDEESVNKFFTLKRDVDNNIQAFRYYWDIWCLERNSERDELFFDKLNRKYPKARLY